MFAVGCFVRFLAQTRKNKSPVLVLRGCAYIEPESNIYINKFIVLALPVDPHLAAGGENQRGLHATNHDGGRKTFVEIFRMLATPVITGLKP